MNGIDWPLIISFISLLISTFLAGWTVYRDAIQKPRFFINLGPRTIIQKHVLPFGPDFYVQATNLGPNRNRIGLVWGRYSWWDRVIKHKHGAFITNDGSHPAHSANGQMVEVGDTVLFVFPIDSNFIEAGFSQIGVSDGYQRTHWASRKETAKAINEAKKQRAAKSLTNLP